MNKINELVHKLSVMPIEYASIMPHGFELIKDLYPDVDEKWTVLRSALENVARDIYKITPDVIVIASPHNLRIDGYIGIITSEWCEGELENENKSKKAYLKWKVDRKFSSLIYKNAKKSNIPIVSVNYGAAGGDFSSHKMDWGTFIPLWYIKQEYEKMNNEVPPIVLITPSREIPWENLVELGKIIKKSSNDEELNIVFIASSDHGHAHDLEGPYGFHPASKEYDEHICNLIRENTLEKILDLTPEFIDDAKPDSFWQMLILFGIIKENGLNNESCVYSCPTYYGMIVASFKR